MLSFRWFNGGPRWANVKPMEASRALDIVLTLRVVHSCYSTRAQSGAGGQVRINYLRVLLPLLRPDPECMPAADTKSGTDGLGRRHSHRETRTYALTGPCVVPTYVRLHVRQRRAITAHNATTPAINT